MSSSSSLCVVCPLCVTYSPPCEEPCWEGPCGSAPPGVLVASGTIGGGIDWPVTIGASAAITLALGLTIGLSSSNPNRRLIRPSRARR